MAIIFFDQAQSGKLEKWLDPSFQGAIEPSAITSARRNPKLFFGVSTNTLYPVSPLTLFTRFNIILPTYYK